MKAFSVLMSIYFREKSDYFNRAMQSIWDEQTVKPNEIVLVKDGQLGEELDNVIDIWKGKLHNILKIIPLRNNVGLGDALNIGLNYCSNEFVARMDTDDISLPNRFEKQLEVLENLNIDICSSWVSEFEDFEDNIKAIRMVPELHYNIVKYAKFRNPVNHPAVMMKKSSVLKAGGYKKMIFFEDYYLWVRMILSGAMFYNIQEVLVNMRGGKEQYKRRSGIKYAINEFYAQKEFLKLGFISRFEFIRNLIFRTSIRLMPHSLVGVAYRTLRKTKSHILRN